METPGVQQGKGHSWASNWPGPTAAAFEEYHRAKLPRGVTSAGSAERPAGRQQGRSPSGKPGADASVRFCREKPGAKARDEKQRTPRDLLSTRPSKMMSSAKEHGVTRAVSGPPDGAFLSARRLPAPPPTQEDPGQLRPCSGRAVIGHCLSSTPTCTLEHV